jgi:hypothetical protein
MRTPPQPGGIAKGTPIDSGSETGRTRAGSGAILDPAGALPLLYGGRPRGDLPVVGIAAERPARADLVSFPFFGPWGRWYPWYTPGFGWNFGFVTYNPWYYGSTWWGWSRYGFWYDPFAYVWDPFWYSNSYGARESRAPEPAKTTGSLRIKANVDEAKVYIDGALAGTVDEFNGLSEHLELESGSHVLELRADGYQTYTDDVIVEIGKTRTVRISMDKVK